MPTDEQVKVGSLVVILLTAGMAGMLPRDIGVSADGIIAALAATINVTATILNVAPEIISVAYPQYVKYGNGWAVQFTVRDNNTLPDLTSLKGQVWRGDLNDWVDYTTSVTGPSSPILYSDTGLAYQGVYTANFKGLPDVGQSETRFRVVASDEAESAIHEATVYFEGYLMFDILEGGEELFAGPPGTSNTHQVVMDVTTNFARELKCFYPGNMSVTVDGAEIGSNPVTVASLVGGVNRVSFTVRVDVPNPYKDDVYQEKIYFIVEV